MERWGGAGKERYRASVCERQEGELPESSVLFTSVAFIMVACWRGQKAEHSREWHTGRSGGLAERLRRLVKSAEGKKLKGKAGTQLGGFQSYCHHCGRWDVEEATQGSGDGANDCVEN